MTAVEKPELAVNRGQQTVAAALNGFISHAATGFVGGACLDVATAYFNVGGSSLLADALDQVTGVRLLLGAEPTPPENRRRALRSESANPQRAARTRLRQALEGHEHNLLVERDHLGFTFEVDSTTRRLVRWLRSENVQVRRLEGRFLHGKAFLVSDRSHGVVAGSSNFTYAGLATNLELNLGNYSPHVVGQVQDWFEELWAEAEEYDLASLFDARFEPHAPQLVFLRMLWEFYGEELEAEAAAEGAPQIHLTNFQSDGLWRARRILEERNGVLIADEVGLGKTFLAGELIREAVQDRRQRVLVITPATLRDGPWRAFIHEHLLAVELVSYEELMADSRLNPEHTAAIKLRADINDYAMVVIDEAHNLRNPGTQRAQALRRLLAGMPPKKLVMLTATPVNNSLWDLYHLLGYFLRNDAVFADAGIRSLRDHFANAMALNPDDLTPEHLFDVLDAVAVRRTRAFVKRFYPNDTIKVGGQEQPIVFPTPRVRKVDYNLDEVMPGFFDRFARALDPEERLHRKIAQAAASIGVGEVLPDQAAQVDVNFTETREEIERLRNENPEIFERGGTARGVLSGEEFRQELRQALEDADLADQIKSLPWGSGSGMAVAAPDGRPGYIFCARVGDHPRPLFRFVEPSTDADGVVIDETLACLHKARPPAAFGTERQLDDATIQGAFPAWETARAHIVEGWNFMADKANLEPKIPPRLRRAAEILRNHPPPGLPQEELDRAIDTINAPYPERTIRTLQAAITNTQDLTEQAEKILTAIHTLGLQPYIPPDPLPEIRPQDVHLMTWLAVVPIEVVSSCYSERSSTRGYGLLSIR